MLSVKPKSTDGNSQHLGKTRLFLSPCKGSWEVGVAGWPLPGAHGCITSEIV